MTDEMVNFTCLCVIFLASQLICHTSYFFARYFFEWNKYSSCLYLNMCRLPMLTVQNPKYFLCFYYYHCIGPVSIKPYFVNCCNCKLVTSLFSWHKDFYDFFTFLLERTLSCKERKSLFDLLLLYSIVKQVKSVLTHNIRCSCNGNMDTLWVP